MYIKQENLKMELSSKTEELSPYHTRVGKEAEEERSGAIKVLLHCRVEYGERRVHVLVLLWHSSEFRVEQKHTERKADRTFPSVRLLNASFPRGLSLLAPVSIIYPREKESLPRVIVNLLFLDSISSVAAILNVPPKIKLLFSVIVHKTLL